MDQIRIITVYESSQGSEQLINEIKKAGHSVSHSNVDSEEAFLKAIEAEDHDLVLCRPVAGSLSATNLLTAVRGSGIDIPVIVLADSNDVDVCVDYMKKGAVGVVPPNSPNYLLLVLEREVSHLQNRRFKRLLEAEVAETRNRCELLLRSSREPVAYVMDGMHIYANNAYVEKFGYQDADEVECVPVIDIISKDDQPKFKVFLKDYLAGESKMASFQCNGIGHKNEPFPMLLMLSSAQHEGQQCVQIMIGSPGRSAAASGVDQGVLADEIRTQVKAEMLAEVKAEVEKEVKVELQEKMKQELDAKVAEAGSIDAVTGAFSRQYFLKFVNDILCRQEKEADTDTASSLFYFSLDKVSKIKNEYSLEGLDELLRQVASYFNNHSDGKMKVAKISDADFCIWREESDEADALDFAKKMRVGLSKELFDVADETVKVTFSVGITFIKAKVGSAYAILSRAMKAAVSLQQEAEGNEVRIYRPPNELAADANTQEGGSAQSETLQKAIDNNLFKILFQPIISLKGEEFEFYEALLRLIDDEGKEISPDQFLAEAKSSNFAEKIDRWVILQSIKSVAARRRNGHDTQVLINLTSQSVRDASLIPWLGVALRAAKLPKGTITFQLNEEEAHKNLKHTKVFVEKIKEFGCQFSISRFGITERPMDIMQDVDVSFVKLDAWLIKNLSADEGKSRHISKLTELVDQLNEDRRMAIAPFVESAGVLSTLWQLGAGYIQGYYLQPPMEDMSYDFSHGH